MLVKTKNFLQDLCREMDVSGRVSLKRQIEMLGLIEALDEALEKAPKPKRKPAKKKGLTKWGQLFPILKKVLKTRTTLPILSAVRFNKGEVSVTDLESELTLRLPGLPDVEELAIDFDLLKPLTGLGLGQGDFSKATHYRVVGRKMVKVYVGSQDDYETTFTIEGPFETVEAAEKAVQEVEEEVTSYSILEDNELKVDDTGKSFLFPSSDWADVPQEESFESEFRMTIDKTMLSEWVKVAQATATDMSRPVFVCLSLQKTGSELVVVAADGFQLMKSVFEVKDGPDFNLLIDGQVIKNLAYILGKLGEDSVVMSVGQKKVSFESEKMTLVTVLGEGEFADYTRIVPGKGYAVDYDGNIETVPVVELEWAAEDKKTLAEIVKGYPEIKVSGVKLVMTADKVVVIPRIENPPSYTLGCQAFLPYFQEEITIGLNPVYAGPMIGNVGCKGWFNANNAKIGTTSPVVWENEQGLGLVMPMQWK